MGELTKGQMHCLCDRCRRSGFILLVGIFKPVFKCQGCDHEWSYGYDGGEYFRHALNVAKTSPLDWVEHPDVAASRISRRRALEASNAQ
jgi:hypothetical protein